MRQSRQRYTAGNWLLLKPLVSLLSLLLQNARRTILNHHSVYSYSGIESIERTLSLTTLVKNFVYTLFHVIGKISVYKHLFLFNIQICQPQEQKTLRFTFSEALVSTLMTIGDVNNILAKYLRIWLFVSVGS